jgi:hypothetical protein
MVAMVVLLVGILGVLKMVDTANAVANATQARTQANALARQVVEYARSLPYGALNNAAAVETQLKALPGLVDDTPGGPNWTIRQRGINYVVRIFTVCTVDDGAGDGYGDHSANPGKFCADSTTTGTSDPNPDDYKRVTVQLSWTDKSVNAKTLRQSTVIDNPGSGSGPAIRQDFAMTTPACGTPPPSTTQPPANCIVAAASPEIEKATFTLTTTDPARAVDWSKDNVVIGAATAAAGCGSTCSSWTFDWLLGCLDASDSSAICLVNGTGPARVPALPDGTYLIGAQAYDDTNNPGPPVALSVTVNRRAPIATTGFNVGWNGSLVEMEWNPNPDNDIVKYQVYRTAGGSPPNFPNDTLICDAGSTATTCQDTSPGSTSGSPRYYLVAWDLNNGSPRAGTLTSVQTAVPGNVPPTAPPNFACTAPCTGNVTFTWTAATDPDDAISFYRLYRTTSAAATPVLSDRYTRTTGAQTSIVDSDTATVHYYWISAVDVHLAESTLVGPITAGG